MLFEEMALNTLDLTNGQGIQKPSPTQSIPAITAPASMGPTGNTETLPYEPVPIQQQQQPTVQIPIQQQAYVPDYTQPLPMPGQQPTAIYGQPQPVQNVGYGQPQTPTQGNYREKRRFKRYSAQFRIILVCGGKAFRTFSDDVSFGGMLLKQQVPTYMLNQVCSIFIGRTTHPENIEFKCRVIGDLKNPRRLSFIECDTPGGLKRLEDWIIENEKSKNGDAGRTTA